MVVAGVGQAGRLHRLEGPPRRESREAPPKKFGSGEDQRALAAEELEPERFSAHTSQLVTSETVAPQANSKAPATWVSTSTGMRSP